MESPDVSPYPDHELILTAPVSRDPQEAITITVIYTEGPHDEPIVLTIFDRNDVEIDFDSLPRKTRDYIEEQCKNDLNSKHEQRNNISPKDHS